MRIRRGVKFMPLYFFDFMDGEFNGRDKFGTKLPDVEDAAREAVWALANISKDVRKQYQDRVLALNVRGQSGETVLNVTLTLAVTRFPDKQGIRDRPTSPRSPWQNGYAERLIGSIRRECLDHVVVFGERHLRHVLLSYLKYYNEVRTHLSLEKDAPVSCAVERAGSILCRPVLGGLHHQYVRI